MKQFLLFLLLSFLAACGSNETDTSATPEQNWFDTDTLIVWNCDAVTESRSRIFIPQDSITSAQAIVNGINKTWPEVVLLLKMISADTAVVTLDQPQWLENKAGSTGAEQYLTFVSMNLLEVKGINNVRFDLPEGSHAGASTWSRNDFMDWKTNTRSGN